MGILDPFLSTLAWMTCILDTTAALMIRVVVDRLCKVDPSNTGILDTLDAEPAC